MTETIDQLIQARFDVIANPTDGRDWGDVLARVRHARPNARRRVSRRIAVAVAAAALALAVTAVGFGWPGTLIEFVSSPSAPKRVVREFEMENAVHSHSPWLRPKILAGEARRVAVYRLRNGKPFPLDVAPRRGGGFCFEFGWGGSCAGPHARRGPDEPGDRNGSEIGLGIASNRGSTVLDGFVYDKQIAKLQVRLKHGSVDVPVLWVSPPIDAGFFFYNLTDHQRGDHTVVAVVAVDAHGKELARIGSIFRPRPARPVPDLSKKRVILRSGNATIAIAPSSAGGTCFWLRTAGGAGGSGCAPPGLLPRPLLGGLSGAVFSAQVRPSVARVELRFQDGAREQLRPVHGFVLYSLPRTRWPRGRRLVAAVAYSSTGKQLARQRFDPQQMGVYPCAKPVPIGAGLKTCP